MKNRYVIALSIFLGLLLQWSSVVGQTRSRMSIRGGVIGGIEIENGDTIQLVHVLPVYAFTKPKDMRRYQRLVNNVKKVYPYAKEARMYLDTLNTAYEAAKTNRQREAMAKSLEKKIVKKYTPILLKMTRSQGKVLIKLIDRETSYTSYELLDKYRGSFSAKFWNTMARVFKANLKEGYDKEGEDALIEQIIILYEAGLL